MKNKDYTIETLLICLLLAILGSLVSCTKEVASDKCQPVIQWLDTYSKENVYLTTDTCKYYGILCNEDLQGFKNIPHIQPGLCDNQFNRYVRTEIGAANKGNYQIFK